MSKHTPGPWKADRHCISGILCAVRHGIYYVAECYISSSYRPVEETEANTRLIAASPDMKEAIEASIRILTEAKTLEEALNALPVLTQAYNLTEGK